MTARDFCFWLQGFFEISKAGTGVLGLDKDQAAMIEKHLSLVFLHDIDKQIDKVDPLSKPLLDAIHEGGMGSSGSKPLIRC